MKENLRNWEIEMKIQHVPNMCFRRSKVLKVRRVSKKSNYDKQNNDTPKMFILIPGTCYLVILHSERNSADVIIGTDLEMVRFS